MLNLSNTLKQTGIYTLGTFLTRGINILLLPFYTRYLNPTDYGTIDILVVTSTLVNLTIALEIHQAIARFYSEWSEEERVINISTAFYFSIFIYTAFIFGLLPFGSGVSRFLLEKNNAPELYAFYAMLWASGIFYFTQSQLRWQLMAFKHGLVSLLFTSVTALSTILFVIYYKLGVEGVMWGLTCGNMTGIVSALYFTQKSYRLVFSFSLLKKLLKFSTPLVLSSISVFLSLYIDRVLIKELLSLYELGLFGVALRFASIVGIMLTGFNNAITPLIYTHFKEKSTPGEIERIFRVFAYSSILSFVFLSAFAEEMVFIFTSEGYYNSFRLIPIMVITTLLSSFYNFTPGLFIANKTAFISFINLFIAALNIVLNLFLLPRIGLAGAPLSTLLSYFTGIGIYYYFGQKYYPIPYRIKGVAVAGISSVLLVTALYYIPVERMLFKYLFKGAVVSIIAVIIIIIIKREKLITISAVMSKFISPK